MSKKILVVICLFLCVLGAGVGTLAYYSVDKAFNGGISMSGLDMAVHETDLSGKELNPDAISFVYGPDLQGYIPGDSAEYNVYCENTCEQPMYIRAKLSGAVRAMDGIKISAEILKTAEKNVDKVLEFDINSKDWTYKNGYYYYRQVLAPGMKTEPLVTGVHFNGENMGSEFIGTVISVITDAEAVQSVNNTDSAASAAGWNT